MGFTIVFNRCFLAVANGFIYFGFRGFGRACRAEEIDLNTVRCGTRYAASEPVEY